MFVTKLLALPRPANKIIIRDTLNLCICEYMCHVSHVLCQMSPVTRWPIQGRNSLIRILPPSPFRRHISLSTVTNIATHRLKQPRRRFRKVIKFCIWRISQHYVLKMMMTFNLKCIFQTFCQVAMPSTASPTIVQHYSTIQGKLTDRKKICCFERTDLKIICYPKTDFDVILILIGYLVNTESVVF